MALLLTACRNGERAGAPAGGSGSPAREAELYFSTEVSGYVEPCGCTSDPLGGVPRLAATLRASRRAHGLVDAGNLLFSATEVDEASREQHLLKARILSRVYRELGAVALNLGHADLIGGLELLKELQREGAFPLVSANVRPVGQGVPSVARSFVRELGGIRFGLTGVARPETFSGSDLVTAIEYTPVLRSELSRLREQGAEILVLLAHVEEADARELAKLLPELDLIVRAPGSPITQAPRAPFREGPVVIAEAGSQGQHIGRLTVRLGPVREPGPLPFDDAGYGRQREVELTERKLAALRRDLEGRGGEETAERRAQVQKLEARLRALEGPSPALPGPSLRVELVPLNRAVVGDPKVEELLSTYYARLKELNRDKGDLTPCQPVADQPVFVGSERCQECHEEAYAFWKKTKHAVAWATLEDANKHFDLTCIGCHTVGYRQPGGFCRISDVAQLKDVGCEMCHGPGSVHAQDQDASSIKLTTTEATCAGYCHVPEHSDTFDYSTYLERVTGEGHELGASAP